MLLTEGLSILLELPGLQGERFKQGCGRAAVSGRMRECCVCRMCSFKTYCEARFCTIWLHSLLAYSNTAVSAATVVALIAGLSLV